MTEAFDIPDSFSHLIGLLRCAVNRCPPPFDLNAVNWPITLKRARQQGVTEFLYPWLAEHAPDLFSARARVPTDSAPAAWRSLFLESVMSSARRQLQIAEILSAFAQNNVDIVPLKGAWLSEKIYDDPAQRGMSDLDLLVRKCDRDAAHKLFLSLGYTIKDDVLHCDFSYDQVYHHDAHPHFVEMHWSFTPDSAPASLIPDLAAIWKRTALGEMLQQPIREFSPEDRLAHLTQHVIHHSFSVPLRGYLDLALTLKRYSAEMDMQLLEDAASDWKVRRGLAFSLGLVSQLFELPASPPLATSIVQENTEKYALALHITCTLPDAGKEASLSLTQARLSRSSFLARVRLALQRVFLSRSYLSHTYPCARSVFGLPLAWLCRARDLYTRYHTNYTLSLKPASPTDPAVQNATLRVTLTQWLLDDTQPSTTEVAVGAKRTGGSVPCAPRQR